MNWFIQYKRIEYKNSRIAGFEGQFPFVGTREECESQVAKLNEKGEKFYNFIPDGIEEIEIPPGFEVVKSGPLPQWIQVAGAGFKATVIIKDETDPNFVSRYTLCALEATFSKDDKVIAPGELFTVDDFDFSEFYGAGIEFELYDEGEFFLEELDPIHPNDEEMQTGLELPMPLTQRTIPDFERTGALVALGDIGTEVPEDTEGDRDSDFPVTATHSRVEMTEPEE